jgi:hypothetical protein
MGGKDALVGYVGRIPAPVRTKLLAAFLLVELLLVALGATGLLALREVEQRAGDLASLQHKIEAYRQMQHDTLRQLYSVSSALAAPDNASLSSALRQINQFGYDLDRVSFVAKDEVALIGGLREEYSRFIAIATRVLELTRAGQKEEARQMQLADLAPLADRLAKLDISIMTCAPPHTTAPPVAWLRSRGVNVCSGSDGIRDAWSPMGNGDMLERAMLIALRYGWSKDDELAMAFDIVSAGGARALGIESYGLAAGCRADFVLLPAENLAAAVVDRPSARTVISRGRVVARDGAYTGR